MTTHYLLPLVISALRVKAGLTQRDLADRLGVSSAAVTQMENPSTPLAESAFERYASALGYTSEIAAIDAGLDELAIERARRFANDLPLERIRGRKRNVVAGKAYTFAELAKALGMAQGTLRRRLHGNTSSALR